MSQLTEEQVHLINCFVIDCTREMIQSIKDDRTKASVLPRRVATVMLATTIAATLFVKLRGLHPRVSEMITLQVTANVAKHFAEFISEKFGCGVDLFAIVEDGSPVEKKGYSINPQHDPSNN